MTGQEDSGLTVMEHTKHRSTVSVTFYSHCVDHSNTGRNYRPKDLSSGSHSRISTLSLHIALPDNMYTSASVNETQSYFVNLTQTVPFDLLVTCGDGTTIPVHLSDLEPSCHALAPEEDDSSTTPNSTETLTNSPPPSLPLSPLVTHSQVCRLAERHAPTRQDRRNRNSLPQTSTSPNHKT